MLPGATQRELELCLAKLLVATDAALVVLMSPTGHVFAWQGTGVYDALIQGRGPAQMPLLDPRVRQRIYTEPAPGAIRPREYGSWVAPDLLLWLLGATSPARLLQQPTLQTVTEVRAVLRRESLL